MSTTFLKAAGCDSSDQVKSILKDNAPALLRMVLEYDGPDMLSEFSRPDNGALAARYVSLFPTRLCLGLGTNTFSQLYGHTLAA